MSCARLSLGATVEGTTGAGFGWFRGWLFGEVATLTLPTTPTDVPSKSPPRDRPTPNPLSLWQLWNMSIGFFGIQFGWGLQMANASSIFESLGANPQQIPLLWLAAPLTGLIVQPLVGYFSDRTWCWLGRRRPYFLVGAIFSSLALVAMPHASTLWMAAGLLWILDSAANISMTPFKALVGDLAPSAQRTTGFTLQALFHGLSGIAAAALPWVFHHWVRINPMDPQGAIPVTTRLSFYAGAAILLTTVLWTVITTREYPPSAPATPAPLPAAKPTWTTLWPNLKAALARRPAILGQLAWVQCLSWLGMFCVFLYLPPAIAYRIWGATQPGTLQYAAGIEWAGLCIALYNGVCCLFAFLLPKITRRVGRKTTHCLCLVSGGLSLLSLSTLHSQPGVLLCMVGLGIAWASMLSLPYAMLIEKLPTQDSGLYLGLFNLCIVLPELAAALGMGWVMEHLLHNHRMEAVGLGGGLMLAAALCTQAIQDATVPRSDLTGEPTRS